jgi:hypothetical protein
MSIKHLQTKAVDGPFNTQIWMGYSPSYSFFTMHFGCYSLTWENKNRGMFICTKTTISPFSYPLPLHKANVELGLQVLSEFRFSYLFFVKFFRNPTLRSANKFLLNAIHSIL